MTQGNPCCHGARELSLPHKGLPQWSRGRGGVDGCVVLKGGQVSTGKVERTKAAWECTQRARVLELWPRHLPQEPSDPKSSSIWQSRLRHTHTTYFISHTDPFPAAVLTEKKCKIGSVSPVWSWAMYVSKISYSDDREDIMAVQPCR